MGDFLVWRGEIELGSLRRIGVQNGSGFTEGAQNACMAQEGSKDEKEGMGFLRR